MAAFSSRGSPMSERFDIAIHGAGAWGTALAILEHRAGKRVALVPRDAGRAAGLAATRCNPHLPGVELPKDLMVTAAPVAAAYLILAPPFQHLRRLLEQLPRGASPIILACKGLETETGLLGPEIAASLHPGRPLAMLTGPNFAAEIAKGLPAAAIIAMADPVQPDPVQPGAAQPGAAQPGAAQPSAQPDPVQLGAARRGDVVAALAAPYFRLYGSADLLGAALAGATKNVIAIAAGVVIGAGFGENARAALVTRGLAEIARFALACGGKRDTVAGLAGLGDLLLTCTGPASRNYRFGLALGQGDAASCILARGGGLVEGVATAPALQARAARLGIEMPITDAVIALLNGAKVDVTMRRLLSRAAKDE
jgi:glycerol-3-phosphate dehydrogenase (NAD(P)+)